MKTADPLSTTKTAAMPAEAGTKARLLDAAEQLFADHGFERVSLRHLTQAAVVNLAAVNYHFGKKDALIDAVIERYVNPINEHRLANLDELEVRHGHDTAIPLREILTAFVQPFLKRIRKSELSQRLFFKLMGRCMGDPGHQLPASTLPLFHQVIARFSSALHRTVPHLSEELILWRLHFTFGILAQTLLHSEALNQITRGRTGNPSLDEILNRIIDFAVAGFNAAEGCDEK